MTTMDAGTRVALKNILYLTDFSAPSERALPFVRAIAREYKSNVYVLHAMIPNPMACATPESAAIAIEAQQDEASSEIVRIESECPGLSLNSILERGTGVWASAEHAIREYRIDLVMLGTHGRTGAKKFFLGSVAEEILRRSRVPVLLVGPSVHRNPEKGVTFRRILFATDFGLESAGAAPYAICLAQESRASLTALHVIRESAADERGKQAKISAALSGLDALFPASAKMLCQPESIVSHGDPAGRIVEIAERQDADLIVLGVHNRGRSIGVATHLERNIAHNVVVQARCPVLTVPG